MSRSHFASQTFEILPSTTIPLNDGSQQTSVPHLDPDASEKPEKFSVTTASLNQNKQTWGEFFGKKAHDVSIGLINAILCIPCAYGYAAIIFVNPIYATSLPMLAKLVLLSCVVHQMCFSLLSSLPFAIGQVQDAGMVFLSIMATSIASADWSGYKSSEITAAATATCIVIIALSTSLLGLALVVMGKLRLAKLVSYLPTPVIAGYLAFIGFFCLQAGLALCSGENLANIFAWSPLFTLRNALLCAPALATGLLLAIIARKTRHPAALPLVMVTIPTIFFITLWLSGGDLDWARQAGWVSPEVPSASVSAVFSLVDISLVRWDLVPGQIFTFLAMTIVVAFSSCLDVAAIEIDVGQPLDINHELVTVGWSNAIAGSLCGYTGSYIFSQTIFTCRTGSRSRLVGVVVFVAQLLVFLLPVDVMSLVPRLFFAGILMFIAFDLMKEWLIDSYLRGKIRITEYLVCLITFVAMLISNIEVGLVVGIAASFLHFIFRFCTEGQDETSPYKVYGSTFERESLITSNHQARSKLSAYGTSKFSPSYDPTLASDMSALGSDISLVESKNQLLRYATMSSASGGGHPMFTAKDLAEWSPKQISRAYQDVRERMELENALTSSPLPQTVFEAEDYDSAQTENRSETYPFASIHTSRWPMTLFLRHVSFSLEAKPLNGPVDSKQTQNLSPQSLNQVGSKPGSESRSFESPARPGSSSATPLFPRAYSDVKAELEKSDMEKMEKEKILGANDSPSMSSSEHDAVTKRLIRRSFSQAQLQDKLDKNSASTPMSTSTSIQGSNIRSTSFDSPASSHSSYSSSSPDKSGSSLPQKAPLSSYIITSHIIDTVMTNGLENSSSPLFMSSMNPALDASVAGANANVNANTNAVTIPIQLPSPVVVSFHAATHALLVHLHGHLFFGSALGAIERVKKSVFIAIDPVTTQPITTYPHAIALNQDTSNNNNPLSASQSNSSKIGTTSPSLASLHTRPIYMTVFDYESMVEDGISQQKLHQFVTNIYFPDTISTLKPKKMQAMKQIQARNLSNIQTETTKSGLLLSEDPLPITEAEEEACKRGVTNTIVIDAADMRSLDSTAVRSFFMSLVYLSRAYSIDLLYVNITKKDATLLEHNGALTPSATIDPLPQFSNNSNSCSDIESGEEYRGIDKYSLSASDLLEKYPLCDYYKRPAFSEVVRDFDEIMRYVKYVAQQAVRQQFNLQQLQAKKNRKTSKTMKS